MSHSLRQRSFLQMHRQKIGMGWTETPVRITMFQHRFSMLADNSFDAAD